MKNNQYTFRSTISSDGLIKSVFCLKRNSKGVEEMRFAFEITRRRFGKQKKLKVQKIVCVASRNNLFNEFLITPDYKYFISERKKDWENIDNVTPVPPMLQVLCLLGKLDNGNIHQICVTEEQQLLILEVLIKTGKSIKMLDTVIDGVEIQSDINLKKRL